MREQNIVRERVGDDLGGQRADKVVAAVCGVSRSIARSMIDGGDVTLAGVSPDPADRVAAGAELVAVVPPPVTLRPEPVPFSVLFENDEVAVVDKPPGIVVHPGAGHATGTLAAGILHRWPQIEGVGEENRWGIVHRLDRDTSGALVIAKTATAHAALTQALAERRVGRLYLALVAGTFDIPTGTIDAPIARDQRDPTRFAVDAAGRRAVTHYEVDTAFDGVALLRVRLDTGRTHQIRVHLASIGHPVCGDRVYGRGEGPAVPRIFLHAAAIDFPHKGGELAVTSPLPADLAAVVATLR